MNREVTNFALGFNTKGFSENEVGIDEVGIYSCPETWNSDDDGEKKVGTPIQVDINEEYELKVCPDGEMPDGFLSLFVGDPYPGKDGLYIQNRTRKFITPGQPAPFIINKEHGVLDTKLFVDGYTPVEGDEIYVSSGKFAGSDPLGGEGVSIGKVRHVKTHGDDTYAFIVLTGGVGNGQVVNEKVEKVNITAPADGTEQDTGWAVPENAIVTDVKLAVNTAEATGTTKTIDVGTDSGDGGDADGYLVGVDVSSTGLVKGTLDSSGQTLGDLLTVVSDDTNSVKVPEEDIASGGKSLTYTAGSADFAELDADIYVFYYNLG